MIRDTTKYIAHVRQNQQGAYVVHKLKDHLLDVAHIADEFASAFGNSDWASLAGLWHDLGKYRPAFQAYIKSASGYDPEAHIEGGKGRVDHSTAGAIYAIEHLGPYGRILAYLIAGHHAGLADWYSSETGNAALSVRLEQGEAKGWLDEVKRQSPPEDILHAPPPQTKPPGGKPESLHLWLRMLFSCLVDADFLDTEAFMNGEKAAMRGQYPDLAELLNLFNRHMREKIATVEPTLVNGVRAQVLCQCSERAMDGPGLFSLTVPTGGGKTLSSMGFALNHAVKYGKKRVIYAIPYTSIIEQTANVFREIFGEAVIEHHSNVAEIEPENETQKSRLACENWEAPIIVTTNVQLFESLFAAKPSRCRKLHNIVESVIVLDEAQLLPPDFLDPILAVLRDLSAYYGVTVVLCTATQPAFSPREGFGWRFEGLPGVQEIIADPDALYRDLKRVEVLLPGDFNVPETWEEIARRVKQHEQALAIVNRRDDARELAQLIPEAIHLSANLCGAHRAKRIAEIKAHLERKKPIRVISTQLIEAGVDVDFPVVYRAMTGLDSIAQAAGRCNREGKLYCGEVHIFIPPKPSPAGLLRKGEETAKELLDSYGGDPLTWTLFEKYFQLYYAKLNCLDKEGILPLLQQDARECKIQFRTAAQRFKLIDESDYAPVIVRYGDAEKWLGLLKAQGPERWLLRKLQRYTVTIPKDCHQRLLAGGDIEEVYPGIFAQYSDLIYDERLGFTGCSDTPMQPQGLII